MESLAYVRILGTEQKWEECRPLKASETLNAMRLGQLKVQVLRSKDAIYFLRSPLWNDPRSGLHQAKLYEIVGGPRAGGGVASTKRTMSLPSAGITNPNGVAALNANISMGGGALMLAHNGQSSV